ncbi:EAL domain-containing protein [Halothiobacillus sp. DCM-1]|uniref:EAL domain-containing protein n=1 Tax=Halothiobacillus sp. DCM-1 TaxID=3112558 RepID=UPI003250D2A0
MTQALTHPLTTEERLERKRALLQALLGQIDLLIAPTDEQTLLDGICTHLLSSGLFVAVWVAQTDPQQQSLKILAAGADTETQLRALDATMRAVLFEQTNQAQCQDITRVIPAEESPWITPWLPWVPAGQTASQLFIPLHRPDCPWAVLSLVVVHYEVLEPLIIDALCHLGELISHTLNQLDLQQQLNREHERTAYLAYHDALTGLANRRFLDEELPKAMARARRGNTMLAVVMLDLDDFKPINDRWGHAAGDGLLKTLGQRLKDTLRDGDLAVRQGGDEFILLIEGIERKKHLSKLLTRLVEVITQPFDLSKQTAIVRVSMGITLFPSDDAEPDQLIRHADAALYVCKGHKQTRKNPWCFWNEQTGEILKEEPDTPRIQPYGHGAAVLLQTFQAEIPALVESFVDYFYHELVATDPASAAIVRWLSPAEYTHLVSRQKQHLLELLAPELTEAEHRENARRVGKIHALIGVSASSLVRAITIYLHQFDDLLARFRLSMQELNKLELILTERLSVELAEELEAEHDISEDFQQALVAIDALSSTDLSWAEFNERTLDLLKQCPGIVGGWIGAPDPQGVFIVNFNSGMEPLIEAMQRKFGASRLPSIDPQEDRTRGATARAFQQGKLISIPSYSTSDEGLPWREVMAEVGIRSSVAIPLTNAERTPKAVLSVYAAYPGMFESPLRQAFFQQVGLIVSQTWQRFRHPPTVNVSVQEVAHWRHAFYHQGIYFDYQPICNLGSGRLEKVEALARLRLDDGRIIPPGAFIPRLNEEQITQLFIQGLAAGLAQLARWDQQGLPALSLSLNLPIEALTDPHCVHWVTNTLQRYGIAPHRLTLELLEQQEIHALDQAVEQMHALKALGISLAMDDLGAGYSGLIRLNNLPFDTVKIDQVLVRSIYTDPVRIIKFISALIHMTHALDLQVVAEGLEQPDLIEALQLLGADHGQGFGLARPMSPERIGEWLSQQPTCPAPTRPRTALGAIAAHWRMVTNLPTLLTPAPEDDQAGQDPAERCPVHQFIVTAGLVGSPLDHAHRRLHGLCPVTQHEDFHQQLLTVQQQLATLVPPPEASAT